MSNRPATLLQADIARMIRAAKKAGAAEVEIRLPDGSRGIIRIKPSTGPDASLEESGEIVL
jgi:hypothetical protein